jgi:hypothetical protein
MIHEQKTALVDDPAEIPSTRGLGAFWPRDHLLVWSGHLDYPLGRLSYYPPSLPSTFAFDDDGSPTVNYAHVSTLA